MTQIKVAYLLLRFPCVTETFIAEEIQKIQNTGVQVRLYSLLKTRDKFVNPVSMTLLPCLHQVPGVFNLNVLAAQFYFLVRKPGQYFHSLWTLLKQPAPAASFRLKRLAVFLKSVWVAKDLESEPVQMVHTHFAWLSAGGGYVVSQLLGIPFTVTTHAYDIYSLKNDLLPLSTREASRVITISESNRRAMVNQIPGLDPRKIHVIHCGVDLDFFDQPENKDAVLGRPVQIISVGSLIEKKGHAYLIRACGDLREKGIDFRCVIIGEGNLDGSLRKLIHDLRLEEQVILAGSQTQVWIRDRLRRSDVFVLACVQAGEGGQDGIPVAMMEALAEGIPVISTPVSGIPELIKDEETGLLVPERDPKRISQAVICLAQNPVLIQRLAKNGRGLIEREYDIVKNVGSLNRIFNDVVEERN